MIAFAVIALISSIYWIVYIVDPDKLNPLLQIFGVAVQGIWVIGEILILMTLTSGGVHILHRLGRLGAELE